MRSTSEDIVGLGLKVFDHLLEASPSIFKMWIHHHDPLPEEAHDGIIVLVDAILRLVFTPPLFIRSSPLDLESPCEFLDRMTTDFPDIMKARIKQTTLKTFIENGVREEVKQRVFFELVLRWIHVFDFEQELVEQVETKFQMKVTRSELAWWVVRK